MKIYTKTGDQGETGLFSGKRVLKSHPLIEAYGTVDELNALLGLALTELPKELKEKVTRIQRELFDMGADLATPLEIQDSKVRRDHKRLIEQLEKEIDEMEHSLKPLKNFILPGGSKASAYLHLARTICRRAERKTIEVMKSGDRSEEHTSELQ